MTNAFVLNNFLPKDQVEAQKELDCYGYCQTQAIEHFMNNRFEKAAIYHENVARSLNVLQRMKKDKQATDQAAFILGQIKAQHDQHELLRELGL